MVAPETRGNGIRYMGMNMEESQDQLFLSWGWGELECRDTLGGLGLVSKVGGKFSRRVLAICLLGRELCSEWLKYKWGFPGRQMRSIAPAPCTPAIILSVHL